MPYVLMVIFIVKQNMLILYHSNLVPVLQKQAICKRNHLIFFFCIFIIDIFSFGGAIRKELLYERSHTRPDKISISHLVQLIKIPESKSNFKPFHKKIHKKLIMLKLFPCNACPKIIEFRFDISCKLF